MMADGKPWILGIADDLTGALETGAKFAGNGFRARVTTDTLLAGPPDVPVLVIDTETRHLSENQAAASVREVAVAARRLDPWLVYKKTDSTLRGNIAAEFRALLEVFPERDLVYAPAYPEMGRTVSGGRLFVGGAPVHETAFANDPLNPIRDSSIRLLLGDLRAEVLDGESSADLLTAARRILAIDKPPLAAGTAALAEALAESLPWHPGVVRRLPRVSRCLVVNGSLHPVSAAQVDFGRTHGCFDDCWQVFECKTKATGLDQARHTGERVRQLVESSPVEAIVVFGGDTAFGIHRAFGGSPFESYAEIVPGVPLSRCGDLFWITKAGGFGAPDVLCDIRRRLT